MTIGLIARDTKKKLMQNSCIAYRGILSKNTLHATSTIGRLIRGVADLNIHEYLAGHLDGMQQMAAQVERNKMDLIIFLRGPNNPKPHKPSVDNVIRLCDICDIPLATNLASVELLIKALDRGNMEWQEVVR